MSVDAAPLARSTQLSRPFLRGRTLSDPVVVAVTVGLAAIVRFAASLPHTTPRYFPDEYLYSALARSLLDGSLEIRGEPAHFPALLESVVTAPLWLAGGVDVPFRLTQLLHAVIAGLAVVPVFAITRRLGLPRWQQLACAAITPLLPAFVFVAYLTADVLGVTLALSAFAIGLGALVTPSRRGEATFLGLAVLATLARFQYVVLVPAFAIAAVAVSGWRPVRAARRFRLTTTAIGAAALAALAVGPRDLLGYYEGLLTFDLSPLSMGKWAATDMLLIGYATGIALAPAATVGFVAALLRPRSAAEQAFAWLTASTLGVLLIEVSLYATNGSSRFQERYLMVILPLVAPFACIGLRRAASGRARLAIAAVAGILVLVATQISLTDYVLDGNGQDSPTLQAVTWLVLRLGTGSAGLFVSLLATGVLLASAVACFRPRAGAVAVFALAAAVLAGASVASVRDDIRGSKSSSILALGRDPRWVDHTGVGPVFTLVPRDAVRWIVSQQLFWNRSVTRVLTLPGAPEADAFQNARVHIDGVGILRDAGRPVTRPLLIQEYASSAQLEDADLLARQGATSLWRPHGEARFVSLTDGRYLDGWLGWPAAMVTVWPGASGSRSGVLCLPLSLPDLGASTTLELSAPGYHRAVTIAAGGSALVAIPRTVKAPWRLHILARRPFRIGARLLSAMVERPRFITGKGGADACR